MGSASVKGTPLDADNLRSRHLKPAAEAIGLEKLGGHDLRRTYTTLGAGVGMDLKDRQGTMGHSRIDMTAMYIRRISGSPPKRQVAGSNPAEPANLAPPASPPSRASGFPAPSASSPDSL